MKLKMIVASLAMAAAAWTQAAEPLILDFKSGEPFTAAFKAMPGDAAKPLLVSTGGKSIIEDGKLVVANSRFTIGALSEGDGKIAPSTGSSRPVGVLDLSKPYKVVVKLAAAEAVSGKDNFFIYVNNSTSRGADSPMGSGSQLVKMSVGELKIGDNVFAGKVGDATSFLQIRAESGAAVKIESISILP